MTYTYDPSGRRIAKSYDGEVITSYVYDGDNCIAEYDATSNLKRKYIFGPCTDEPISMIEAAGSYAGTYYYHFDALGSVVALTNSSGNTVEVYEYSVFGQVGASDPNHPNRFMFTGREFDKETGLYHYRARYFNPQIGRFLQTDPVGYKTGMNLYRYCTNNPVTSTDPDGSFTLVFDRNVPQNIQDSISDVIYCLADRIGNLDRQINNCLQLPDVNDVLKHELLNTRSILHQVVGGLMGDEELDIGYTKFSPLSDFLNSGIPGVISGIVNGPAMAQETHGDIETDGYAWPTLTPTKITYNSDAWPIQECGKDAGSATLFQITLHELGHIYGIDQDFGPDSIDAQFGCNWSASAGRFGNLADFDIMETEVWHRLYTIPKSKGRLGP